MQGPPQQLGLTGLKKQLAIISREIRQITERIEACNSLNVVEGFSVHENVLSRLDFLETHTKLGREPSKAIILLVLHILEALKSEPASEKSIKDFIAIMCGQFGLKATNRGSIAGANIEVSAVCNILCSLGLIEPVSESATKKKSNDDSAWTQDSSSSGDTSGAWLYSQFLEVLSTRWQKALSAPSKASEESKGDGASSAGGQNGEQTVRHDILLPPLAHSSGMNHDLDSEMDFMDIFLERSEHLDQHELSAPMPPSALDDKAILSSDVPVGRSDALMLGMDDIILGASSGANECAPSKLSTQRRGPSSSRVWRVRNDVARGEEAEPSDHVAFLLHAESVLDSWTHSCAREALALEMEERLLRKVVSQCGLKFPLSAFQVGTKYLKRTHNSLVCATAEEEKVAAPRTSDFEEIVEHPAGAAVTADVLIDKVRKSKRQRAMYSAELGGPPVEMFDSSHLSRLSSVCHRSSADFWARKFESQGSSSSSSKRVDKKAQRSGADPITLSEFLMSPLNSLSGSASGPLLVSGPGVTTTMMRRYSKPMDFSGVNLKSPPRGAQSMVDLMVTSVEIPWASLAAEFQTIEGVGVDGDSGGKASADKGGSAAGSVDGDDSTTAEHKRQVLAPSYRLVEMIPLDSASRRTVSPSSEDPDEVISDQAYLDSHENVLRNMRDKWATIQQLKIDTRKDLLGPVSASKKAPSEAGVSSPGLSSSTRHYRTYGRVFDGSDTADKANGSLAATGFSKVSDPVPKVVKKRGRPPKLPRGGAQG